MAESIRRIKIDGGAAGLEPSLEHVVGALNGDTNPEVTAPYRSAYDGPSHMLDFARATNGPGMRLLAGGVNHLTTTATAATSALAWSLAGLGVVGNLTVGGNATIAGTLAVSGLSTLNGAAIAGDLGVTGNTTLGNAAGSDTLTVHAISTFNGPTTLNGATIAGNLGVTGNGSIGGNLTVTGNLTVSGALALGSLSVQDLTVTGTSILGNGNADQTIVTGLFTVRNATATAVQLHADAANNRVIVGSISALGSDTSPNLQVVGRLYVAPESANDFAQEWRRSNSHTVGWRGGVESTNDFIWRDDGGNQIVRFGDASSTYQLDVVTGDFHVADDATIEGDVLASRLFVGVSGPAGGEEMRVNGQTQFDDSVTGVGGTFTWQNGGNKRIEAGSTGLGFFGAAQIARPTIVGSRAGNVALENLLEELANLGLVTDLTTA